MGRDWLGSAICSLLEDERDLGCTHVFKVTQKSSKPTFTRREFGNVSRKNSRIRREGKSLIDGVGIGTEMCVYVF